MQEQASSNRKKETYEIHEYNTRHHFISADISLLTMHDYKRKEKDKVSSF